MANVGTLQAKLTADTSSFISSMGRAAKASATVVGAVVKLGAAATAMGAAVVAASTKMAGDFESSLTSAAAKTDNFEGSLSKFRQTATQVGLDTAFSAQQAAEGLEELVKTGYSATQATAALQPITNLAAAEQLRLAEATELTTGVLKGFGLGVEQTAHVTDVLVKASTSASTTAQQLGEAMSYVSPAARAMGVSMEETAGAAAILAEANIKGSRAGTTLRGTLAKLKDVSGKLGADLSMAEIQSKGLGGSLDILQEHGLTAANAMEHFGTEAGPGVAQLLNAGTGALEEMTKKMEEAGGTAASIAKKQLNTFNGQMQLLKGTVETGAIMLGTVFTKASAPFISAMTKNINKTLSAEGSFRKLVIALAKGLIPVLGNLNDTLRPYIPLADGVVRASKAFGKALRIVWNVIVLTAEAVGVLVTAIGVGLLESFEQITKAAAAAAEFVGQGGMAKDLYTAADAMDGLGNETTAWLKSLKGSNRDVFKQMGEDLEGIGVDLSQSETQQLEKLLDAASKGGKKAAKALEEYVEQLKKVKTKSEGLGKLPTVASPEELTGGATGGSGGGKKSAQSNVVDLARYQGQSKVEQTRREMMGATNPKEVAQLERKVELMELLNSIRARRLEIEQQLKEGDVSEELAAAQKKATLEQALTEKLKIEQSYRKKIKGISEDAADAQKDQYRRLNDSIGAAGSLAAAIGQVAGANQKAIQGMQGLFGVTQKVVALMSASSITAGGIFGVITAAVGLVGTLMASSKSKGSSTAEDRMTAEEIGKAMGKEAAKQLEKPIREMAVINADRGAGRGRGRASSREVYREMVREAGRAG